MAFVAVPAILAGIGWFAGASVGYATLGAAIGWTVGAWLFAPSASTGNDIFDPGAEELPTPNQALRGTTMPVIFGTVRINSNIVWTKNFTTVRNETTTGSGGKAGGSGGGKSGSGPTQVSYEYKWDMMFHICMSPRPVTLYGGWVGANKISGRTIEAILGGSGNVAFLLPDQNARDDVDFTFDDAYFGRAYETGADEPEWDGFATQEGHAARWPNTAYVIFDQLNLGSSPRVPQFSWEVGMGQGDFTIGAEFQATAVPGFSMRRSAGMMRLDDGTFIFAANEDSGQDTAEYVNADTGARYSLTEAQLIADLRSQSLMVASDDDIWLLADLSVIPIRGTKYTYVALFLQEYFAQSRYVGMLYELTNAGTFVAHYGFRYTSSTFNAPYSGGWIVASGQMDAQALDDNVLIVVTTVVNATFIYKLPSPDYLLGANFVDDVDANTIQNNHGIYVPELNGYFGAAGGRTFFASHSFFLPRARIGILGIEWDTDIYLYRARNETINGPTDSGSWDNTNDDLYPNGYITRIRINRNGTGGIELNAIDPLIIDNDLFLDNSGQPLAFPFADDDEDRDGTSPAVDDTTGYIAPTTQKLPENLASYTWLVLFPKLFSDDPAANVIQTGNHTTIRAFLWDAFAGKATEQGEQSGSYFDETPDLGVNVGKAAEVLPYFDETTGELFAAGIYGTASNKRVVTGKFGDLDINGQTDVSPPYIIYEILTNEVFGANVPTSVIDATSYNAALAYCATNAITVSVIYNREESVLDIVNQLLALYGGFLIVTGGKIKFGLQDVTSTPVRTIDNNRMVVEGEEPPVQIIAAARQDSFNKVRVNYFDRTLSYRQNQVEVSDEVDMDLNGVRIKEFPPKFVMTEQLAGTIATRALWTNLYAREAYQFKLGIKDSDLEPGDVLTLVDSFHTELSGGARVRIGRISQQEAGILSVVAVRELEYTNTSTFTALSVSSPTNRGVIVGGVGPAFEFRAYELPYELQPSANQVLFGYNTSERTAGARLYISPDNVTFAQAGDIQPFVINGIFATGLPVRPTGYVETNVDIYLSPASGFNSASPTYVQTYGIDNVDAVARAAGLGTLIAGSEALAMEGLTLIGQNHYRVGQLYRGWGGTPIQDHSSGSYWHRNGGGVLGATINEDQVGTTFWYKVVPYNFNGQGYNVASVPSQSWTVKGTPFLPQPVGHLDLYVASATQGQSLSLPSGLWRNVAAGGSPVTAVWRPASRTTGFGTGGYGAGEYGRFARDVTTPSYRVEVLSGNTVIRSTTVNTEAFVYPVDTNSADFNAWAGQFQLRVTEYNAYGNAPYSAVHSVNLF